MIIVCIFLTMSIVALILLLRQPSTNVNTVNIDASLLAKLPHRTNKTIDTSHLASGVIPPTNHWFSGIALNKDPKAVFPLPLSVKPTGVGFSFGLPVVSATANTIAGGYNPAVKVGIDASSYMITRYDSVSVSLRYERAGLAVGTLTMAEGTPYMSYVASADQQLNLPGFTAQGAGLYQKTVGNQRYAFVLSDGSYANGSLNLSKGATLVLYAVANGSSASDMSQYARVLRSVDTTYSVGGSVVTKLQYRTASGTTLYAALPGQNLQATAVTGSYDTIYGTLRLYKADTVLIKTAQITPSDDLSLSILSSSDKSKVISSLKSDTLNTELTKTDTYFGGKELYRAANLYAIAEQLGQKDQAVTLKAALESDLGQWFDPNGSKLRDDRYFYYDTTAKGLVGMEASFGSEEFNDHQFHYGYFLYAMGVMAKYDRSFADKHESFVRLLAYDITSPSPSAYFPQQRVFDPYFGHSWASGYGQFDDGNNQESSSEAINAWNGLALWAQANGDKAMAAQATWQLSREVDAANRQWTGLDTSTAEFKGFDHNTMGINWGGKRDYATFFSAEPAAILGIQLIPMNPAMVALSKQGDQIQSNLKEAIPDGNYDRQFGDYLLMYRALVDRGGALTASQILSDTSIDDANSRTYLMAWILSR